jgi:hypothetical protein
MRKRRCDLTSIHVVIISDGDGELTSRNFLFGNDFNRAYRWIVDSRSKVNFDFALGRGFNMLKRFDQWFGAGFPKNIKSSEKHGPVTRNIKHPAAHASNAAILNSEPVLHKVQLQSVLRAGSNRYYVMEVPKSMPFVKTTIADFGSITSKTTEAAAEEVPFRHPNIAVRIHELKVSDDDPDRKHAMRSARQNFNRIYKCLRSGEVHMNGSVARGRDICK